ncbi:hypothetical protein GCM10010429_44720 [Micromonospora olivasterospora]|uniref:Regulatory LuxR family protein n=1 Tax=Micromonospora olivasterospora TaxID=1880 RepID=A0A562IDA5_MICOL|nr:regulatory LuxR family protein [Micromonospora olivasterospora]
MLTQGPSRLEVYAGKLLALTAAALAVALAVFAVGAAASGLVAVAEAQPAHWPSAGDLLTGIGAGWLIATMWAMLGAVLAVALRAVAPPVGLGLVWMLCGAERLVLSPATARTHVSRAMVKLGARDRAQLVVFAYQSGLVDG